MQFSFNKCGRNRYLNYPSSDYYRLLSDLRNGRTTIAEIEKTWILTRTARALLEDPKVKAPAI